MTSFVCTFRDSIDLCGNGATCQTLPSPSVAWCDCGGTGHARDFAVFHDKSCFLPSWYYLFFLVVSTTISWILLPFIANETRRLPPSSRTRRIGLVAVVAVLANWMYSVGLYVQNGAFEICAVSLTISAISHLECGLDMVKAMTRISRAVSFEESQKFLARVTVLVRTMNAGWLACMVAMLALCRSEDDTQYNLTVAMFFFVNILAVGSLGPIIYFSADTLLKVMFTVAQLEGVASPSATASSASKEQKLSDVAGRVRRLRRAVVFLTVNNLLSLLPLPVIHLVLGSFPYFFVIIVLFCCTLSFLDFAVLHFLRKKRSSSASSNTTSSRKHNNNGSSGKHGGGGREQPQQQQQQRAQTRDEMKGPRASGSVTVVTSTSGGSLTGVGTPTMGRGARVAVASNDEE